MHNEENISKTLLVEAIIDTGIFSSFEYVDRDALQNARFFLINIAKKKHDCLNVFDDKILSFILVDGSPPKPKKKNKTMITIELDLLMKNMTIFRSSVA